MTDLPRRIVVFTGDPSFSVMQGIAMLMERAPDLDWLLVHHAPVKSVAQLWRNQRLNFKRNGWRWVPYQAAELMDRVFKPHPGTPPLRPRTLKAFDLQALSSRARVRLEQVQDIHAPSSLALVRAFSPTLGLSLAAPILKRPLFSIPTLGTLNLHKGSLPDFRGMPPAFWELWHDQVSVGCSVHQVDDKLDTGAVVARDSLPREAHSSLRGLQLQLDELGNRLLCKAVLSVLDGTAQFAAQTPGSGQTFRKPTLAQQAALKAKLRATASSAVRPTGVVKEVCFALANAAQGAVLRPLIAPRVTVVLYHRVTDAVRDNLSVGVEQFARQMALLKRHFEVLGIEEVLALQAIPRSSKPLVAVTFDDGYLDNYTLAVPILLRHQIPAAFFVSTGLMGTDKRFPHDVRRSNPAIPVMGWDHLREMKALGFTLGSHSVEHIDCAAESELRVRAELRTSRQALESELGLREVVFAYPYGGRQHMTAERLELVKQAGYIGCLSAYGGSNVGVVDRFNVLRKGINHEFSDRAFVWQCLGLR